MFISPSVLLDSHKIVAFPFQVALAIADSKLVELCTKYTRILFVLSKRRLDMLIRTIILSRSQFGRAVVPKFHWFYASGDLQAETLSLLVLVSGVYYPLSDRQ